MYYTEQDLQEARAQAWDEGNLAGATWGTKLSGDPYAPDPPSTNPYRHPRDGEIRYDVTCCFGKSCTTDIERHGDKWYRRSNQEEYRLPVEPEEDY